MVFPVPGSTAPTLIQVFQDAGLAIQQHPIVDLQSRIAARRAEEEEAASLLKVKPQQLNKTVKVLVN